MPVEVKEELQLGAARRLKGGCWVGFTWWAYKTLIPGASVCIPSNVCGRILDIKISLRKTSWPFSANGQELDISLTLKYIQLLPFVIRTAAADMLITLCLMVPGSLPDQSAVNFPGDFWAGGRQHCPSLQGTKLNVDSVIIL